MKSSIISIFGKPTMHCAGIQLSAGNHDGLPKACVQETLACIIPLLTKVACMVFAMNVNIMSACMAPCMHAACRV